MDGRTSGPSKWWFAFVLLCFLFPFLTVSCPGGSYTFSGLDLAFGSEIQELSLDGKGEIREVGLEPFALLALLSAAAGLAVGFTRGSGGVVGRVVAAGSGFFLLFLLRLKIHSDVQQEGGGMLQGSFQVGYWLALLGFLGALVVAGYQLRGLRAHEEAEKPEGVSPEPPPPATDPVEAPEPPSASRP